MHVVRMNSPIRRDETQQRSSRDQHGKKRPKKRYWRQLEVYPSSPTPEVLYQETLSRTTVVVVVVVVTMMVMMMVVVGWKLMM